VKDGGFENYTFVIAPFYYQNLAGVIGPRKQPDGSMGRSLPLAPDARCIHMGDINEPRSLMQKMKADSLPVIRMASTMRLVSY
jgi:hypothetical protein